MRNWRSLTYTMAAATFILQCISLIREIIQNNHKNTCAFQTHCEISNRAIHIFSVLYMILLEFPYLPKQAKTLLDNFFDFLFGLITFPIIILGAIFQTINLFTTPGCLPVSDWVLLAFIVLIQAQISRFLYPKLKLCWQIHQEKQRERNQSITLEPQERNKQPERREIPSSMFDILIKGDFLEICDACNTDFNHSETAKMLKIMQIFAGEKWRKRLVCPECKEKLSE